MGKRASWLVLVLTVLVLTISAPRSANALTPEARREKIAMMVVFAPTLIEVFPAWLIEIAFAAELAAEAGCDPDPCRLVQEYKSAVRPATPSISHAVLPKKALATFFSGPISDTTVRLFRRVLDTQTQVAAYEVAVQQTTSRVFTARSKGDKEALIAQQRSLRSLIVETALKKRQANVAWRALVTHLQTSSVGMVKLSGTSEQAKELWAKGFSTDQMKILRDFGLSDEEIARVRHMASEFLDPERVPKSFKEAGELAIRLNKSNEDIAACRCMEPAEAR
jgi:hypothetical protein